MNISKDQAVYRARRFNRKGDVPAGYQFTYEIIDDSTHQLMAVCDLTGKAAFSKLVILDHQQKAWQMRPNRKIMPSRWDITDPRQDIVMQFDQNLPGKMINPLCRIILTLKDDEGKEVYRLIDPRTNIPDRIFGAGPDNWVIMSDDKPVAKLVRLARQPEPVKGFFGKLKRLLSASDRGIISAGSSHVLPGPVALGMLLLLNELTETSGG